MRCLNDLFQHVPPPTAFFSDRGQHFNNAELRTFLREHQVDITYSPSGTSKSTGMIEKGNDLLELVIRRDTVGAKSYLY